VKVSRKGVFPTHSGGNYNINLHSANARVNIRSTDNSTNTAIADSLLTGIRHAVENGIPDQVLRAHLLGQIEELEKAKDQGSFTEAYQALIASAADHVTILTPFLPASLSYYRLPLAHHKHMKSTNMLERLNQEIKRRTHVVRIFPNPESCLRLIRALAVEMHENWLEAMRYLDMDHLKEHKRELLRQAA
jgi:Transposase, Mutator family